MSELAERVAFLGKKVAKLEEQHRPITREDIIAYRLQTLDYLETRAKKTFTDPEMLQAFLNQLEEQRCSIQSSLQQHE